MLSSRLLTIFFLLLYIGGCAGTIPEPISYPYSQQNKMQASHHWEVLAADLANRINNQLIITDNIDKAVFVKETCGNEAVPCGEGETGSFNEAFRDLLITYLVDFGIPTRNEKEAGILDINYKVQVVRHNADRRRSLQPGLLSTLSATVVVLRDAPSNLVIMAAGAAADVANSSLVVNGHYEVIITTSIVKKQKYLFRSSDIYYINDKDFWHYLNRMPQTKTIKVSTGKKPTPAADPQAPQAPKAMPEASVSEPAPLQFPFDEPKDV
ncbi:MAG TPA: hypothetical protein DDY32_11465 [Desulfobulbaceae bacterium]|nr:hypothetical protein [Desulfobulbaceae bacterium]